MSRVLVLAEHRRGELREVSLEVVGAARSLPGADVTAALLGGSAGHLASELARYVPRVLSVDGPGLAVYTPGAYVAELSAIIESEDFELVLLPHSYHGMDLAGRLATRLLTDLFALRLEGRDALEHVDRDSDRPSVIGDCSRDRLTNPPGSVSAELVPAAIFVFLNTSHQASVPFLNKVKE